MLPCTLRNKNSIYLDRWLSFHPYSKPSHCDYYYLRVCNDLRKILDGPELNELDVLLSEEEKLNFCCFIACYLEDVVSEAGIWKAFLKQHEGLYGKILPFYEPEDYYPGEVNLEDIFFLTWYYLSMIHYNTKIFSPLGDLITLLGMDIFDALEPEYELAPENPALSEFLFLEGSEESYFTVRIRMEWIVLDSYLFHFNREEFEEMVDREFDSQEDDFFHKNRNVISYELKDSFVLSRSMPLLAGRGKDWLAEILGNEHPLYNDIRNIGSKKSGYFLFKKRDDAFMYFQHIATDRIIPVTLKSMQSGAKDYFEPDETVALIGFVKWKNEWWFSGTFSTWDYNADLILDQKNSIKSRMLFEGDAKAQSELLEAQYEFFLKEHNGKPVAFVNDTTAAGSLIREFYTKYNKSLPLSQEEKQEELKKAKEAGLLRDPVEESFHPEHEEIPGMVYFNPVAGIETAFGFNDIISDPDNPHYNRKTAHKDVLRLLYSTVISKELFHYLLHTYNLKGLEFPGPEGDKLLMDNLDFMLRFWKAESYHSSPRLNII